MARPRRDSDEAVLERIATVLETRDRISPWTLEEIAPTAGLSPAGLVKRFGSRKGVLVALSRRWIDAIPRGPRGEEAPRVELQAWLAGRFASSQGAASALSHLIDDLVDDDLSRLLVKGWSREQAYLASLLEACDLPRLADPAVGAALLFDTLNGAALRGAASSERDLVMHDFDTLMEMWT